jgi:hypothetical protein
MGREKAAQAAFNGCDRKIQIKKGSVVKWR